MAISQAKKDRLAKRDRQAEVMKHAYTAGSEKNPFGDANWDDAARRWVETGDDALRSQFPPFHS